MIYLILITFVFLSVKLFNSSNLIFIITNLALLIAYIQFILSSYLVIYEYTTIGLYPMNVQAKEYFTLIIPYFIALYVGLNFRSSYFNNKTNFVPEKTLSNTHRGYSLIIISFLFSVFAYFGILSSIDSFARYLAYIGGFYLVFGRFNFFDKVVLVLIFINLFYSAIASSIFIEFFVWILFLYFILNMKYSFKFVRKISFMVGLVFFVFLVQGFKSSFRANLRDNKDVSSTSLFTGMAIDQIKITFSEGLLESTGFSIIVLRLNQGWHIEQVMNHVPSVVKFSYGLETIDDIINSILPRILMPSKKAVSNRDKFIRYTGYNLSEGTAMTIGVFGDAYINFGSWGFIFLFFVGYFFIYSIKLFIKNFVFVNASYILWLPFFSHYFIRAGNDFYMVINSLIKGFVLFFIINFIWKKMKI